MFILKLTSLDTDYTIAHKVALTDHENPYIEHHVSYCWGSSYNKCFICQPTTSILMTTNIDIIIFIPVASVYGLCSSTHHQCHVMFQQKKYHSVHTHY